MKRCRKLYSRWQFTNNLFSYCTTTVYKKHQHVHIIVCLTIRISIQYVFLFVGAVRITYPTKPKNITMHAPDQLKMRCSGTGDTSTKVHWFRNNSEGVSVNILPTRFEFLPFVGNIWNSELQNKPPKDKFPYTYQCVASHLCHRDVISEPYTVYKKEPKNNPPTGLKNVLFKFCIFSPCRRLLAVDFIR